MQSIALVSRTRGPRPNSTKQQCVMQDGHRPCLLQRHAYQIPLNGSQGRQLEGARQGGRQLDKEWLQSKTVACAYLPVGARNVHRRQAVGRAAERFVQPLNVCEPHLGGVEQVNL